MGLTYYLFLKKEDYLLLSNLDEIWEKIKI